MTLETGRPLIYDLDLDTLMATLNLWGETNYRGQQIWSGIYKQLWHHPEQFTTLSKPLRRRLKETYSFQSLIPIRTLESEDGETSKTLFKLPDKQAIETVLMRYQRRRTLCISTQVGCAMGCVFCATGQMGFKRHLSSGEIIEQVLYYARKLAEKGERVTNIVVMGMGEPFHNYDATKKAIDQLIHPKGFHFGARRFTISTIGLIPAIIRFANENRQVNLAISLHAANNALRDSLLPINRKYPIEDLLKACKHYVDYTNRRITFEWALIQNLTDTTDQANQLGHLLQIFRRERATLCHVNIIPLNPTGQYEGQSTKADQTRLFQATLQSYGIPCTIRARRGIEIQAGCGQLASQEY